MITFQNPNLFTGNPLNRAGVLRKNKDWVDRQREHQHAKFLPFSKGEPLLTRGDTQSSLTWLDHAALPSLAPGEEPILLGLKEDVPHWAFAVSEEDEPHFATLGQFTNLRGAAAYLSLSEAAIAGQAAWLLDWHRRHQFCARYGRKTISAEGGFKRINPETGTEHFPRTDPVAIMLPLHQDQVCLGRSPHFPEGMMSAFAGFVEPCETLEECAAREIYEEVGLTATCVEYVFSQPWPFPASLMSGFFVKTMGCDLTLDPTEITEARWFSPKEAKALIAGEMEGLFCPPPFAIAHQLLKAWLARYASAG
ncbi:MAG: NAD(+) diphosphatase [Pseudomonadota bacterium]